MAVSRDGKWFVTGSSNGNLHVWEQRTGWKTLTLAEHNRDVFAVALSPDGQRIVSGGRDKTLRLWDATSGRQLRTLAHQAIVTAVAVSPDGKWIVSGSLDGMIKVWDATALNLADSIRVDGIPLGLTWNGRSIWVGCRNSTICRYDHRPGSRK